MTTELDIIMVDDTSPVTDKGPDDDDTAQVTEKGPDDDDAEPCQSIKDIEADQAQHSCETITV